jgi:hypothetical protein
MTQILTMMPRPSVAEPIARPHTHRHTDHGSLPAGDVLRRDHQQVHRDSDPHAQAGQGMFLIHRKRGLQCRRPYVGYDSQEVQIVEAVRVCLENWIAEAPVFSSRTRIIFSSSSQNSVEVLLKFLIENVFISDRDHLISNDSIDSSSISILNIWMI